MSDLTFESFIVSDPPTVTLDLTLPEVEPAPKQPTKKAKKDTNPLDGVDMTRGFYITKQANGKYRWFGHPSTNAQDRDKETIRASALEMDVLRTKTYGDDSTLRLHHIPFDLGGAPDFRAVVEGVLVETGEFHDTPEAKAIAEWIIRTPEGPTQKGWGMSIGFYGVPDSKGIYDVIRTKERSVLALDEASNPYTDFNVQEVSKMALNTKQTALLELIKSDPEAAAAADLILAAQKKSVTLDETGVSREKAAGEETTPAVTEGAPAEVPTEAPPTIKALSLDDEDALKQIAQYVTETVTEQVKAAQDNLAKEVNEQLVALVAQIKSLQVKTETLETIEKGVEDRTEVPRQLALYERLKAYSATASDSTVIKSDDPLAKKKPAEGDDSPFAAAGLK